MMDVVPVGVIFYLFIYLPLSLSQQYCTNDYGCYACRCHILFIYLPVSLSQQYCLTIMDFMPAGVIFCLFIYLPLPLSQQYCLTTIIDVFPAGVVDC